jgi:hypothetical protein
MADALYKNLHKGFWNDVTYFKLLAPNGLVLTPATDTAPAGWGKPFFEDGAPINPPLGTVGGSDPGAMLYKDATGTFKVRRGLADVSGGYEKAVSADGEAQVYFKSVMADSDVFYQGKAIPRSTYAIAGGNNRVCLAYVSVDVSNVKWLHLAILVERVVSGEVSNQLYIRKGKLTRSTSNTFTTLGTSSEYRMGSTLIYPLEVMRAMYLQSNCKSDGTLGFVYCTSTYQASILDTLGSGTGRFSVNMLTGAITTLANTGENRPENRYNNGAQSGYVGLNPVDQRFGGGGLEGNSFIKSAPSPFTPVGDEITQVIWRGFIADSEVSASIVSKTIAYSVAYVDDVAEGVSAIGTDTQDETIEHLVVLRQSGLADIPLYYREASVSRSITYYISTDPLDPPGTVLRTVNPGTMDDSVQQRFIKGADFLRKAVVLLEDNGFSARTIHVDEYEISPGVRTYDATGDLPSAEYLGTTVTPSLGFRYLENGVVDTIISYSLSRWYPTIDSTYSTQFLAIRSGVNPEMRVGQAALTYILKNDDGQYRAYRNSDDSAAPFYIASSVDVFGIIGTVGASPRSLTPPSLL